jgi:spore coat protein CotH
MNPLSPSLAVVALARFLVATLLIFLAWAAAAAEQDQVPRSDLFDSHRVLKIEISVAPADWEKLRNQERDIAAEFSKERLNRSAKSPYTWFSGDISIDGTRLKNVGLRKRGFIGSADKDRPGLNIEFDKFVKGQRLGGRASLKLHNNKQDSSNVRQAIAYRIFNAAGVPAPRCNFATVTVNGTNLGVYSNLEGIDPPFLKRHFGDDSGNLYEAQISDFRPGWTRTFEKKNNGKDSNRDDLDAVVKALQADDAQLLAELGRVLDIDSFISFWAVESLINHWDGFAGDLNNCFVYHDPCVPGRTTNRATPAIHPQSSQPGRA